MLTASTLYWSDEVRETEDVLRPPTGGVDDGELKLATQLIEAMAAEWEPEACTDTCEERLEELIEGKAEGRKFSYEEEEPAEKDKVVALDDALRKSLQERRQGRAGRKRRSQEGGGRKGGQAPKPRQSDDPPTKTELMRQAKELGVPGRSKMTRGQLADAVSRAG